jgi:hypothetical protein
VNLKDTRRLRQEQARAEFEALQRLDAVRVVTEAFLAGHWPLDADVLGPLAALVAAAEGWAQEAAEVRRAS